MLARTSDCAFYHQRFSLGDATFRAALFAKPTDWSLRHLSQENTEFGKRVGRILYDMQVGKALAPNPTKFTDRIIESAALTTEIPVGDFVLHRNPGSPADGVPLQSGEAFVISPANCPITIMTARDKTIVMHTGRDCLIDRHELEHGFGYRAPGRTNRSVCHSAFDYLYNNVASLNSTEVYVKVLWGAPGYLFPHSLTDSVYGEVNSRMRRLIINKWGNESVPVHGDAFHFDLPKLIEAQCMSIGVPKQNIDLTHAYNASGKTWLNGKVGAGRNLVIVSRVA